MRPTYDVIRPGQGTAAQPAYHLAQRGAASVQGLTLRASARSTDRDHGRSCVVRVATTSGSAYVPLLYARTSWRRDARLQRPFTP